MLIKVHLKYTFYDRYYYVFIVLGCLSSYDYIFSLPTVLKQVE